MQRLTGTECITVKQTKKVITIAFRERESHFALLSFRSSSSSSSDVYHMKLILQEKDKERQQPFECYIISRLDHLFLINKKIIELVDYFILCNKFSCLRQHGYDRHVVKKGGFMRFITWRKTTPIRAFCHNCITSLSSTPLPVSKRKVSLTNSLPR